MAFNIMAETAGRLDYAKIHKEVYSENLHFDFIPMSGLGPSGGDALGICVPLKNANEVTWEQLKPILKKLRSKFGCEVYDLYGGQKLSFFNIETFKKNFLL